jgi:integrase/recombinase XerD
VERVPTGYYTREEFAKIIDATYAYGDWRGGYDFQNRGTRLRALLLVMRWGGLALTDAVTLERSRLEWAALVFRAIPPLSCWN